MAGVNQALGAARKRASPDRGGGDTQAGPGGWEMVGVGREAGQAEDLRAQSRGAHTAGGEGGSGAGSCGQGNDL